MFFRYYITIYFEDEQCFVGVTPDPDLERYWLLKKGAPGATLAVGIHPYPLGVAFQWVRALADGLHTTRPPSERDLRRIGRRVAAKTLDYPIQEWRWLEPMNGELPGLSVEEWRLLSGRILTGMEIASALNRFRGMGGQLEHCLQGEVLAGRVHRYPGIDRDQLGRPVCSRCGEKENLSQVSCAYCGGTCLVCHACQALGPIRECIPIYRFASQPLEGNVPPFEMRTHSLSPVQQRASRKLADFVVEDERRSFLVWAVCGAGKTELVFETIRQAILRRERILYAVPRREVVLEIGKRMEYAFSGVPISVLVGGEGRRIQPEAALTVATTHQVLRFAQHFPLLILDEADAYPYEGCRMLRYGMERARSPGGRLIYLTATPTRELRKGYDEGRLVGVRIPARHHGYPLPVPEFWAERLEKPGINPSKRSSRLQEIILDSITQDAPVMIFMPTVALGEQYVAYLQHLGDINGFKIGWVHAGHPQRDMTVSDFRQGKIRVLMTTTVMERGLNFPGVHVLVLHAERDDIFDVESLVQIAGRAGRYPSHPTGKVIFWGERVTPAMTEARELILGMNAEAEREGLLTSRREKR